MKYRTLLFLVAFFLLSPAAAFAQCRIGGNDYNEGRIQDFCQICDSARSATEWSPVICPLLQGIDPGCQTSSCNKNTGCFSKQLPEHTRCVDPTCSDGAITQKECSQDGKCDQDRVKSCQGFACLDAVSCTTQCQDSGDCQSPAICVGQTCQLEMNTEDMGNDASSTDMGGDMKMKVDFGMQDMIVSDMKTDIGREDTGTTDPVTSGGGCATTSNGSSWFGLILIGFLTIRRSKNRV